MIRSTNWASQANNLKNNILLLTIDNSYILQKVIIIIFYLKTNNNIMELSGLDPEITICKIAVLPVKL